MFNFIYNFIFSICSLLILIRTISYGMYEFKNENNKHGGIVVITFSLLVTIGANIIIWSR